MWSIGEFLKVRRYLRKEEREVRRRFRGGFSELDLALKRIYFLKNPYRICSTVYGETPLTTLDLIAKECKIGKGDHLYELGAGRGRAALFLSEIHGCKVTAIDQEEVFINLAAKFSSHLREFRCENFFETDVSPASCVYLYGSSLTNGQVERLIKNFESLEPRAKIVSISYPIEGKEFKLEKTFVGSFPWGEAEIFLTRRI